MRDAARAGRPLLLGPDVATQRPEGAAPIAGALRHAAHELVATARAIVDAGAELVLAPTTHTTAPALHRPGQAYRAAALTATAVDLTRDAVFAARTAAAVLGAIDADAGGKARQESRTHVERLVTSAIDGVLLHARDLEATLDLLRTSAEHGVPALVELPPADARRFAAALSTLAASPAVAVLVVRSADVGLLRDALAPLRAQAEASEGRLTLGARLVTAGDPVQAQREAAAAWQELAALGTCVLGVDGPASLAALRALAELVRGDRLSLPAATTRDR
ncbi:MAG: hypothetical protein NVS3B10_31660 [Polyangiales bacterium]